MAKVYAGDAGTKIRLNTGIDLTGATVEIRVTRGKVEITPWPGVPIGTFVEYVTNGTIADISAPGTYKLQAHVDTGSGWVGLGQSVTLKVHKKFL